MQALPKALLNTEVVGFPESASHSAAQAPPRTGVQATRLLNHGILIEPPRIPTHVNIFEERPLPPEAPWVGGALSADLGVDLLSMATAPAEHLSRPVAPPSVPQRVPVTSTIEAAKLISRVQPIYPRIATQAHIQGDVVLHAIIGKDGGVSELQVVSGHPLLVGAALEAVRQWRYSPTLLSGQPVEVETTITVSFVLWQ